MDEIWILPITFSVVIILILSFCIISKCRKKKNIVNGIDIIEINKFCGLNNRRIPSNTLYDFSHFERIKNKVMIEKLQNSLPVTHRSPKNNESIKINMIMYNPAFNRRSHNNIDYFKTKHIDLRVESNRFFKLAKCETIF
jgi:hypothetical protein